MWPSTGRGRREIWPGGARPLSEIVPQEKSRRWQQTVMLHFPSAAGPAPHPPSGSRRCKSWAKALAGKEGGGRRAGPPPRSRHFPGSPSLLRINVSLSRPPHPATIQNRRQTHPRLPVTTPPRCAGAAGHHGPLSPCPERGPRCPSTHCPPKMAGKGVLPQPSPRAPGTAECCAGAATSRDPAASPSQAGLGRREDSHQRYRHGPQRGLTPTSPAGSIPAAPTPSRERGRASPPDQPQPRVPCAKAERVRDHFRGIQRDVTDGSSRRGQREPRAQRGEPGEEDNAALDRTR